MVDATISPLGPFFAIFYGMAIHRNLILFTLFFILYHMKSYAVIGGAQFTPANSRGYVSSVALGGDNVSYIPSCSGTLISDGIVLTAEHCRSNSHIWFKPFNSSAGFLVSEKIKRSPFHFPNRGNVGRFDIALNYFESNGIPEGYTMATLMNIPFWDSSYEKQLPDNYSFEFVGYGQIGEDSSKREKRIIKMSFMDFIENPRVVGQLKMKAIGENSGVCFGDSGGSLYLVDESKNKKYLVGVTSGFTRSVTPEAYDLVGAPVKYGPFCSNGVIGFMPVPLYIDWIQHNVPDVKLFSQEAGAIIKYRHDTKKPVSFDDYCQYQNFLDESWYTFSALKDIMADNMYGGFTIEEAHIVDDLQNNKLEDSCSLLKSKALEIEELYIPAERGILSNLEFSDFSFFDADAIKFFKNLRELVFERLSTTTDLSPLANLNALVNLELKFFDKLEKKIDLSFINNLNSLENLLISFEAGIVDTSLLPDFQGRYNSRVTVFYKTNTGEIRMVDCQPKKMCSEKTVKYILSIDKLDDLRWH